jgi:SCP-2 sterol transfer family
MRRAIRFFFMHLGTLVGIIVYFSRLGVAPYPIEAVQPALWTALVVHGVYTLIARALGEQKQMDLGLLAYYGVGLLGSYVAPDTVLPLYQHYSPALLFTTLGLTAAIPLVLGREPFTVYYARRQVPAWQLKLKVTDEISRLMATWWAFLFFVNVALCVSAPENPLFTALLPNLNVILLGLPSARWLPPLYLRFFPPGLPETTEALIMGMPFVFDPRAAKNADASIQFRVSGAEPGEYHVRILNGRCETFTGRASAPDLTVNTPDRVWLQIARGELDGTQALMEGRYQVEGKAEVLTSLETWFPRRG